MMHNFSEDAEESMIERRSTIEAREAPSKKIDNEEEIPLIPNLKGDQRRTIVHLEVWKQDPPNDGFRGTVATTTDYASISKLFGNGLYEFRAVTQEGKVLRRHQGVRIAYTAPAEPKPEPIYENPATPDLTLLKWQSEQHAADSKRIEDFGRMTVDTTRDIATTQLRSMTAQYEASIQRDREYHASLMQQQREFFQQMMLQAQTAHNQSMERTRQENNLVVQIMQQSHERLSRATDPTTLLNVFQQGMLLNAGQDDEPEEIEDIDPGQPWVKALESGAGIVKDMVELSRAPKNNAQAPAPTNTAPPTQPPAKKKKSAPLFSKSELSTIIRAKRLMQQKGLDFEGTVNNALRYLVQGAPVVSSDDEPEPDGDDTDGDSESAPASDVDDS